MYYWNFFSLNVSIMTLPLFEKTSLLVEKTTQLVLFFRSSPQAICGLMLHYNTICGFPKPNIFQQNRGVAGCRQKNQSCRLFLPVVWKSLTPNFRTETIFIIQNVKVLQQRLCSLSANVNVPPFFVLFWHISLHYFVRRGNRQLLVMTACIPKYFGGQYHLFSMKRWLLAWMHGCRHEGMTTGHQAVNRNFRQS